jgi:hypothetical protein
MKRESQSPLQADDRALAHALRETLNRAAKSA